MKRRGNSVSNLSLRDFPSVDYSNDGEGSKKSRAQSATVPQSPQASKTFDQRRGTTASQVPVSSQAPACSVIPPPVIPVIPAMDDKTQIWTDAQLDSLQEVVQVLVHQTWESRFRNLEASILARVGHMLVQHDDSLPVSQPAPSQPIPTAEEKQLVQSKN